jgi:hypothetical protein
MADEYNAELHQEMHRQVLAELKEIKGDVKTTNGRVNKLETEVAVLQERNPGKQGGAWGAVAGAIGGFVAGLVKP